MSGCQGRSVTSFSPPPVLRCQGRSKAPVTRSSYHEGVEKKSQEVSGNILEESAKDVEWWERKKHRPRRKGLRIRSLWRCELVCGHTAFSLRSEPHEAKQRRMCESCGKRRVIRSSAQGRFAIPLKDFG